METERAQDEDGLPPWEAEALEALRWHWGEAYMIGHDGERGWWAARRDKIGGLLTGADPAELEKAILADYSLRPVPRDLPADGDPKGGALIVGTGPGT
jgi:hypothetical protein